MARPVPLLYVSDTQINAVMPLFLSGATALVHVTFNSADTSDFVAAIVDAIPEVFQGPDGSAAAVNQDGTINSREHPAPVGSVIAIWVTGIGATPFGVWQDGRIAPGPADFGCCQILPQKGPADVLYGGAAPGIVAGVAQVNFRAPVPFPNSSGRYGRCESGCGWGDFAPRYDLRSDANRRRKNGYSNLVSRSL